MLKSLIQQRSSRFSFKLRCSGVRFFLFCFFFPTLEMTDSVQVVPERLFEKGFFHFNVFFLLGKGRRGCMLFSDTLLDPFRFPPYSSFFSNDKEIRGLAAP